MSRENLPRTGRIGRFVNIVEEQVDVESLLKIMQDADCYSAFKPEGKANWWKSAIERLSQEIGEPRAIEIMQACGRRCCNQGNRKTAKRLMAESGSLQEFLVKASEYGVKPGELEYKLKDKNTVIGCFYRCFCGQVKKIKEPFPNLTYCNCSAEFHKMFFEAALEKSVSVEVTQSIINGADHCEFVIHI